MPATIDELKDLLATLDPNETKQLLDETRDREQWTSRPSKSRGSQETSGLQAGAAEARRRYPEGRRRQPRGAGT